MYPYQRDQRSKYEIGKLRSRELTKYENNLIGERELEYSLLTELKLFTTLAETQRWLRTHSTKYKEWYEQRWKDQQFADRGKSKLSKKTNYSQRELARRALIVKYNQELISTEDLEQELKGLFQAGDHPLNSTTVITTLDIKLWIAQRSARYIQHLKKNFPMILEEIKEYRAQQQRQFPRTMFADQQARAAKRDIIDESDLQLMKEKLKDEKDTSS